jgi:hypothetical protein
MCRVWERTNKENFEKVVFKKKIGKKILSGALLGERGRLTVRASVWRQKCSPHVGHWERLNPHALSVLTG